MPNSNDNQDFGKADEKNKDKSGEQQNSGALSDAGNFTSDDQKGKQQVDADPTKESERPADQKD